MSDEYDRGVQDQRLQGHDDHLQSINGSLEQIAKNTAEIKSDLGRLTMNLQRLTDAVDSNQQMVVTTAAAVEAERKSTAGALESQRIALKDSTERKWSPLSRMAAIVALISAVAGLVVWLISLKIGGGLRWKQSLTRLSSSRRWKSCWPLAR